MRPTSRARLSHTRALFSLRIYAPSERPEFAPDTYGVFVVGPDGKEVFVATVAAVGSITRVVAPVACGVEYLVRAAACNGAGCSAPLEDGPFRAKACPTPPVPPPAKYAAPPPPLRPQQQQHQMYEEPPPTFGSTMKTYFTLGIGVSLGVTAFSVLLRMIGF